MKSKLLIIQLTIFMLFCASCAKAQTLGAGISVDSQGNLVINAPLYVFDRYGENPKLEKAPTSINSKVLAFIPDGDSGGNLKFSGGIVKGQLSIIINKPEPDENNFYGRGGQNLIEAMDYFHISESFITNGANIEIGQLELFCGIDDNNYLILLYPNRNARILFKGSTIDGRYVIEGDNCEIYYSLGEVNISSKIYNPERKNWYREFDLHLKQDWNIVSTKKDYNYTLDKDILILNSITLSKDAVWVLIK